MQKKKDSKTILRVYKAYKRPMLLGFFLGISLVCGSVLVSQVVGNEKQAIIQATKHGGGDERQVEVGGVTGVEGTDQLRDDGQQQTNGQNAPTPSPPTSEKKRFTVLLIGVDRRPGETSISNTDSILVANINTENGKVALLSIPRDTQVTIPGNGTNKINAAARVGKGLKTTTTIIEGLTGQTLDGYVMTNFSGFKKIIDTLGGITVTVDKDMHYVTGDKTDGVINLNKGTQRLNGTQALQYARFRQDALADISRATRQQAVLKAMEKEFLQVKTVSRLPWLIPQMSQSVETNLSVAQLWSMANILLHFEKPEIYSQTLPGDFLTENDISYWKVDTLKSRAVVKRFFEEGKTTSVFFNGDTNLTVAK
ncbi:LCP family protein [Desulfosporosinus sp. Sb-LF]|uniref:LCP family protein n=1 Tax=Desulfosporosinus sp. Sb-LF TaxID=2560027 RepID=UPI00107F8B27|nr:LCP family protein [Desulfosporosinus sp. Sb-LF]TGE34284.1 LytR family transcriptional regulator [Desulfosporosinus sp. Sb-LF]